MFEHILWEFIIDMAMSFFKTNLFPAAFFYDRIDYGIYKS